MRSPNSSSLQSAAGRASRGADGQAGANRGRWPLAGSGLTRLAPADWQEPLRRRPRAWGGQGQPAGWGAGRQAAAPAAGRRAGVAGAGRRAVARSASVFAYEESLLRCD